MKKISKSSIFSLIGVFVVSLVSIIGGLLTNVKPVMLTNAVTESDLTEYQHLTFDFPYSVAGVGVDSEWETELFLSYNFSFELDLYYKTANDYYFSLKNFNYCNLVAEWYYNGRLMYDDSVDFQTSTIDYTSYYLNKNDKVYFNYGYEPDNEFTGYANFYIELYINNVKVYESYKSVTLLYNEDNCEFANEFNFFRALPINECVDSIISSFDIVDKSYTSGYNSGFNAGNSYGYDLGFGEGYSNGFADGYNADTTAVTVISGIMAIAAIPVNFFLSIFNFEILGINLTSFVTALLSICIVLIISRSIFNGGQKK